VLSLLTWLCGIGHRAGYDSGGRGRWYSVRVQPLPGLHELDQALRLLTPLGIGSLPLPTFFPGQQGVAEAAEIMRALPVGRPLALLAPGGGLNPGTPMPEKRWSASGFAGVAATLQGQGAAVALVGANSDRAASDAVLRTIPELHDLTGQTTLAGLGALAGRSSLFIGNDSGVTHLAAAAGCPTVAIFGPTAPQLYAPRGPSVQVVAPDAARMGGLGSVRDPFIYDRPWQEYVTSAMVCAAALAALRPFPPAGR
jgi:heptosyltransferase-2/heptosyltransferase-3